VLRDCVARTGGLEEGLRCYVGVTHPEGDDNGYTQKVLAEQRALQQVAAGKSVPHNLVHGAPTAAPAASAASAHNAQMALLKTAYPTSPGENRAD
jgi:hypothetical protein